MGQAAVRTVNHGTCDSNLAILFEETGPTQAAARRPLAHVSQASSDAELIANLAKFSRYEKAGELVSRCTKMVGGRGSL